MARNKRNNSKKESLPSQRQQRVGELLRHALSAKLMRGELPEPMLYDRALLVGEVRMTADLRLARVYINRVREGAIASSEGGNAQVIDDKITTDEKHALLKALQSNAHLLQKSCAAPLGLKFTPKIIFVWDELPEQSARIERLLRGKAFMEDSVSVTAEQEAQD